MVAIAWFEAMHDGVSPLWRELEPKYEISNGVENAGSSTPACVSCRPGPSQDQVSQCYADGEFHSMFNVLQLDPLSKHRSNQYPVWAAAAANRGAAPSTPPAEDDGGAGPGPATLAFALAAAARHQGAMMGLGVHELP